MNQEIPTINTVNKTEKIKNLFLNNKKKIIVLISTLILLLIGYFIILEINKKNQIKIANQYNNLTIKYIAGKKINIEEEMVKIINMKDKTYSPLALYFLLDNNIIVSVEKTNELFDIIIDETKLNNEIRNLIIYKKALYNSENDSESNLLKILNPVINSDSVWKSHALYLLGEYFLSKNEKQKSKEFFEKILITENANSKIKLEAQKRIQRDLSE